MFSKPEENATEGGERGGWGLGSAVVVEEVSGAESYHTNIKKEQNTPSMSEDISAPY